MIDCLRIIEPHVHFRGDEYPDHNFLELGFRDLKEIRAAAALEQPNPKPWLVDRDSVRGRRIQANMYRGAIHHGVHIGMTNDPQQVTYALDLLRLRETGSNSDKTFYTHSTGNMGILEEDRQKHIWWKKVDMGYRGVSIGHFEDEKEFVGEFDWARPISHSERQTPESELVQVERQVRNAYDFGFNGTFYIAHVSNPDTVDYIDSQIGSLPFEVVLEVTYHHMFLNTDDYEEHGNRVKMNPPLRSPEIQQRILEYVLAGRFDVIGTDHAPHPVELKDSDNPPSGIPVLPFVPRGLEILAREGMCSDMRDNLTFHNPNKVFNLGLEPKIVEVEHNPELWDVYEHNPFSRYD